MADTYFRTPGTSSFDANWVFSILLTLQINYGIIQCKCVNNSTTNLKFTGHIFLNIFEHNLLFSVTDLKT